jgi:hypothetical protein
MDLELVEVVSCCIESEKFKQILCDNKWGSYNIDWRLFKYFKKDFWKELVES